MHRSPYYGALKAGRALTALLGLTVLLLGSLTASAVTTATATATGTGTGTGTSLTTDTATPTPSRAMTVSGHHDDMNCDPIRFGTTTAAAHTPSLPAVPR